MNRNLVKTSALLILTSALSTGCIIHVGGGHGDNGEVSSILGSLEVGEGKHVTDVSSVNGDVSLMDSVTAANVSSVNGSMAIGNHVSLHSLDTVNGSIETGHHFMAQGSVSTVNGDINILADSMVKGSLSTVNGDIKLNNVTVAGDISTNSGSITLSNHSTIAGDIVFEPRNKSTWGWEHGNHTVSSLTIETGSMVEGRIILNQKVDLNIENKQLMNKVEYHKAKK